MGEERRKRRRGGKGGGEEQENRGRRRRRQRATSLVELERRKREIIQKWILHFQKARKKIKDSSKCFKEHKEQN